MHGGGDLPSAASESLPVWLPFQGCGYPAGGEAHILHVRDAGIRFLPWQGLEVVGPLLD